MKLIKPLRLSNFTEITSKWEKLSSKIRKLPNSQYGISGNIWSSKICIQIVLLPKSGEFESPYPLIFRAYIWVMLLNFKSNNKIMEFSIVPQRVVIATAWKLWYDIGLGRNFCVVLYKIKLLLQIWYKSLYKIHWLLVNKNRKEAKSQNYLVSNVSLCNLSKVYAFIAIYATLNDFLGVG